MECQVDYLHVITPDAVGCPQLNFFKKGFCTFFSYVNTCIWSISEEPSYMGTNNNSMCALGHACIWSGNGMAMQYLLSTKVTETKAVSDTRNEETKGNCNKIVTRKDHRCSWEEAHDNNKCNFVAWYEKPNKFNL